MKSIIVIIVVSVLVSGCKKESDALSTPCNELAVHAGWKTITFKSDYYIQVPDGYTGWGMAGLEGNTFWKCNSDSSVILSYDYCDSLHCNDFGGDLSQSDAANVILAVGNSSVIFDRKVSFCNNQDEVGLFYYKSGLLNDIPGRLFWRDSTIYREALTVTFDQIKKDEVISILKTIQKL